MCWVQARAKFLYVWFKPVGNTIDESGNNGLWRLIGAWMVTIMGLQEGAITDYDALLGF